MIENSVVPRVRPRLRRALVVAAVILLPLAIHAIWDQLESALLARAIASLARRGEPVDVMERRVPPGTPEQRHAASLYAAAADLAADQARDDGYLMTRKDVEIPGADPRLDPARLTAYLARAAPALHLLEVATPLDFRGFGSIAPELHTNQSSLETLGAINSVHADILSARGEGGLAAAAIRRSIVLLRTITIPFYRSLSSVRLLGSLRILLKRAAPRDDALRELQAAFEAWPDEDGLAAELQRQRAQILGAFWPHPVDRGSWALRPRQGSREGAAVAVAFIVFRPLLTHAVRRQFGSFEQALAVAREPWPAKLDSARGLAQLHGVDLSGRASRQTFLQRMAAAISPTFGVWQLEYALPVAGVNLAVRRTAIAALAIERFRRAHDGQPPSSLDALVPEYLSAVPQDPFDGKPLKYRLASDSYIVYSVERDRMDDGGILYGPGSGVDGRPPARRDLGVRVPITPATDHRETP